MVASPISLSGLALRLAQVDPPVRFSHHLAPPTPRFLNMQADSAPTWHGNGFLTVPSTIRSAVPTLLSSCPPGCSASLMWRMAPRASCCEQRSQASVGRTHVCPTRGVHGGVCRTNLHGSGAVSPRTACRLIVSRRHFETQYEYAEGWVCRICGPIRCASSRAMKRANQGSFAPCTSTTAMLSL